MRFFTGFAGLIAPVYASVALAAGPAAAPQADLERGKQLATTVCAACHGADGNSTAPANPNLAGQHADYIAAQLEAFKSGARPSPRPGMSTARCANWRGRPRAAPTGIACSVDSRACCARPPPARCRSAWAMPRWLDAGRVRGVELDRRGAELSSRS